MKKIGILHGKERSFPEAFIGVNSKNVPELWRSPYGLIKPCRGTQWLCRYLRPYLTGRTFTAPG
jgi:hypothetical protein